MPLSDLETPAVVVDRERLLRNIVWAQALATARGVRLRPHVKTHKCNEIAQLQLEHGAAGITASKVDEALVFIDAGVASVTVAYPLLDQRKIRRLLTAAKQHGTDLRMVVDTHEGAELLAAVAAELRRDVGALIEIDVGLRRCGMIEGNPAIVEVAQFIENSERLRFVGLLSHAGHAYGSADAAQAAEIAANECGILQRVRAGLEGAGIQVDEVSVGSTPTVLASETYDGITEIRPGNYVFMDRTPLRLGLISLEQVALTVLTTVVSRNDTYLITDAGSKVLTSDLGAHGTAGTGGYGLAFEMNEEATAAAMPLNVVKLSEEHGFIAHGDRSIPIGTKLRIVPNHSCPVVNLADELLVVSGHEVVDCWPVAARGKVR